MPVPARSVIVHPYGTRLAVVARRSPGAGTGTVGGGLGGCGVGCGDGVSWSVDRNSTTLASGAVGDGGSQQFAAGTGGGALNSVAVAVGDSLYFTVGPGAQGDYQCDTTGWTSRSSIRSRAKRP